MDEKCVKVDDIVEYCNTYSAYLQNKGQGVAQAALRRVTEFAKENSADVQPVKHGKWLSTQRTVETGTVYCSNCAIEYYISALQTVGDCNGIVHYCPNCGTRMIKDGDTE